MKKKTILQIILILFISIEYLLAQGPPPPAMPTKTNRKLIDRIIEKTNHKKYFVNYCTKKIRNYAKKNNWSKTKTDEKLAQIDFDTYSFSIYNSYAFYSAKQLKKILEVMALINRNEKGMSVMILTNTMMQDSLESYVERLLKND